MSVGPTVAALDPPRAIAGGRLWIRGEGFPRPELSAAEVTMDGHPARVVFAAPDRLAVEVPRDLSGAHVPVKLRCAPGATLYAGIGRAVATGIHQVDSPVFDRDGRLYVTCSGSRGQDSAVSIYRCGPGDAREVFATGIVNATGLAVDPSGRLHVSSRYDGIVYRLGDDGTASPVVTDLGVACGLAFAADGTLFVGDRSGTVHRADPDGRVTAFATLPASVAAFHLAATPEGTVYVAAPTLATRDVVYRISPGGEVSVVSHDFGRPQGLALAPDGSLYVVEALAGVSGVYRLRADGSRELVVSGPGLVGVAFGPGGVMAVASSDTVYRFE